MPAWLRSPRTVTSVLVALGVWDIILSYLAILRPHRWFELFHAAPAVDPQALLQRTGAVWIAFTVLQFVAAARWQRQLHWLPIIAGVRWTELFSDWTYAALAQQVTPSGKIGLFIAPPANLVLGMWLMSVYRRARAEERRALVAGPTNSE